MRAAISAARRRAAGGTPQQPTNPAVEVNVATFTTKVGDGVAGTDTVAKSLTIAFGTTATSLRGEHPVTVGERYRVSWSQTSTNATQGQAGFGTSLGGPQYRPTIAGVEGANSFDFTAVSTPVYITFQRASAGSTTFSAITTTVIPEVTWRNLSPQPITPSTWAALSAGVTVDATSGAITLPATGTLISAAGAVATTTGKLYRLVFNVGGNTVAAPMGTTQGSTTIKSNAVAHAVGLNTYEFTAQSTTTWVQFQRQTTGTATVTGIALQEISTPLNAFSAAFSARFD